jgi:ribosomal protein L37AE/L43A
MVKKYCEFCRGVSYSSNDTGVWICPYCGCDLTEKPAEI